MDVTKPYKFIGLGAMYVTKPYNFIWFGGIYGPSLYEFRSIPPCEEPPDEVGPWADLVG